MSESQRQTRLDVVAGPGDPQGESRPWLGVYFACAGPGGAYQRVFRSPDGRSYAARCPKCGKTVRFAVGDGGTNQRFFEVRC